jgi:hypothetical protein
MNCNIISVLHFTDADNIPFHYIPHLVRSTLCASTTISHVALTVEMTIDRKETFRHV